MLQKKQLLTQATKARTKAPGKSTKAELNG